MKLLADESVEASVVKRLRDDGYDVHFISELAPGSSDNEVLSKAKELGAILLTNDKDFGELVFRMKQVHTGVVLLKLEGMQTQERANTVVAFFENHGNKLAKAFSVISRTSVRIRLRQDEVEIEEG